MFQTDSINFYLSSFDLQNYDQIDELIIDKFSIDGSILNIYLEDLKLFPNLKKLTLRNLNLSYDDCIFLKMLNLNYLCLINCDILNEAQALVSTITSHYLCIDNCNLICSYLSGKIDKLEIIGIDYLANNLVTNELDISRANVNDKDILLSINTSKLIISKSQFFEELRKLSGKVGIVIKNDDFDIIEGTL